MSALLGPHSHSTKPLAHAGLLAEQALSMPVDIERLVIGPESGGVAVARLLRELNIDSDASADAIRVALVARWLALRTSDVAVGDEIKSDDGRADLPKWRLKRVLTYIDANIERPLLLVDLAAVAGLSRMYFASRFRATTGSRPHEYVLRRRIARAKELLEQGHQPLVQIALSVGFQTQSHFSTVFKKFAGLTPRQWRGVYQNGL